MSVIRCQCKRSEHGQGGCRCDAAMFAATEDGDLHICFGCKRCRPVQLTEEEVREWRRRRGAEIVAEALEGSDGPPDMTPMDMTGIFTTIADDVAKAVLEGEFKDRNVVE